MAAGGEWMLLIRLRLRRRRIATEFPVSCGRALDRRHFAILVAISAFNLAMELWFGSRTGGSIWDRGLSAFGLSTLIVVWHAWSRPVLAGRRGLMLGVTYVGWNGVEGVTVNRETGGTRVIIGLREDHPFYQRTVVGATTTEQADLLLNWVPKQLLRERGHIPSLEPVLPAAAPENPPRPCAESW